MAGSLLGEFIQVALAFFFTRPLDAISPAYKPTVAVCPNDFVSVYLEGPELAYKMMSTQKKKIPAALLELRPGRRARHPKIDQGQGGSPLLGRAIRVRGACPSGR